MRARTRRPRRPSPTRRALLRQRCRLRGSACADACAWRPATPPVVQEERVGATSAHLAADGERHLKQGLVAGHGDHDVVARLQQRAHRQVDACTVRVWTAREGAAAGSGRHDAHSGGRADGPESVASEAQTRANMRTFLGHHGGDVIGLDGAGASEPPRSHRRPQRLHPAGQPPPVLRDDAPHPERTHCEPCIRLQWHNDNHPPAAPASRCSPAAACPKAASSRRWRWPAPRSS